MHCMVNLAFLFAAVPGSTSLHRQKRLTPLVFEAFAFNHENNEYVCAIRGCKAIKNSKCRLKLKAINRHDNKRILFKRFGHVIVHNITETSPYKSNPRFAPNI